MRFALALLAVLAVLSMAILWDGAEDHGASNTTTGEESESAALEVDREQEAPEIVADAAASRPHSEDASQSSEITREAMERRRVGVPGRCEVLLVDENEQPLQGVACLYGDPPTIQYTDARGRASLQLYGAPGTPFDLVVFHRDDRATSVCWVGDQYLVILPPAEVVEFQALNADGSPIAGAVLRWIHRQEIGFESVPESIVEWVLNGTTVQYSTNAEGRATFPVRGICGMSVELPDGRSFNFNELGYEEVEDQDNTFQVTLTIGEARKFRMGFFDESDQPLRNRPVQFFSSVGTTAEFLTNQEGLAEGTITDLGFGTLSDIWSYSGLRVDLGNGREWYLEPPDLSEESIAGFDATVAYRDFDVQVAGFAGNRPLEVASLFFGIGRMEGTETVVGKLVDDEDWVPIVDGHARLERGTQSDSGGVVLREVATQAVVGFQPFTEADEGQIDFERTPASLLLRTSEGLELPGCRVRAVRDGGQASFRAMEAELREGALPMELDLAVGTWRIQVEAEGLEIHNEQITLDEDGGEAVVEGGFLRRLRGRIVEMDGSPAVRAEVKFRQGSTADSDSASRSWFSDLDGQFQVPCPDSDVQEQLVATLGETQTSPFPGAETVSWHFDLPEEEVEPFEAKLRTGTIRFEAQPEPQVNTIQVGFKPEGAMEELDWAESQIELPVDAVQEAAVGDYRLKGSGTVPTVVHFQVRAGEEVVVRLDELAPTARLTVQSIGGSTLNGDLLYVDDHSGKAIVLAQPFTNRSEELAYYLTIRGDSGVLSFDPAFGESISIPYRRSAGLRHFHLQIVGEGEAQRHELFERPSPPQD